METEQAKVYLFELKVIQIFSLFQVTRLRVGRPRRGQPLGAERHHASEQETVRQDEAAEVQRYRNSIFHRQLLGQQRNTTALSRNKSL